MKFSTHAHLIGIYGPGGSIIPDVFFDHDIDFITSFRIADTARFSEDMINDNDMEFAVRASQKQYMLMRPLAKTQRNIHAQNTAACHKPVSPISDLVSDVLKNPFISDYPYQQSTRPYC